jgi:hypothetical protein
VTGQSMMDEQTVDQFELRHKIRRGSARSECRELNVGDQCMPRACARCTMSDGDASVRRTLDRWLCPRPADRGQGGRASSK